MCAGVVLKIHGVEPLPEFVRAVQTSGCSFCHPKFGGENIVATADIWINFQGCIVLVPTVLLSGTWTGAGFVYMSTEQHLQSVLTR